MSIDGIEQLPQDVRDSINNYMNTVNELNDQKMPYNLWQHDNAQTLASKKQEKRELLRQKNLAAFKNSSDDEKQQLLLEISTLTEEIMAL